MPPSARVGRPELSMCVSGSQPAKLAFVTYETGRFTTADARAARTREDFISFIGLLLGDFSLGGGETEWENSSLGKFLEALSDLAETGTMMRIDEPSWQAFAELIAAATGYE
jgi:hypothetical protein